MKPKVIIFLIVSSIALYSCNKNNSPATAVQIPNPGLAVSLVGYGESLDSSYYKVWSDSSWEEFGMDTTINGTIYTVLLDYTGNEYFYGPGGYSGFWQYGGNLILFDSALVSLPDTMVEGQKYTSQTTFTTSGVTYTLIEQDIILDTTSVTVPFGSFSDCLLLQSTSSIIGGGQTSGAITAYWMAKGPSDIFREYDTGYSIYMAYGVVNGIGWGVSLSKSMPSVHAGTNNSNLKHLGYPAPLAQSRFNLHGEGPEILKGIIK